MAIAKLVEEDPLRVNTDHETGQVILRGMGELHLEIIIDRLRREFKVEINQGAPRWPTKNRSPSRLNIRKCTRSRRWSQFA